MGAKLLVRTAATRMVSAGLRLMPPALRAVVADRAPMIRPMDYGRTRILLHVDSEIEYFVRLKSASKEPETVRWLEECRDGDVLYDIGANVGAYALIAAKLHQGRVRVCAFEPSALNFGQLLKNLALNDCGDTVMPLPIALAEATRLEVFNYQNTSHGGALHSVGDAIDEQGRPFTPAMRQRMLLYSLDDVVRRYQLEPPTHIKIDVDGGESAILAGAPATLASPTLRSLLVETDTANGDAERVTARLEGAGFRLDGRHHQGRTSANLVFVRDVRHRG